MKKITKLLMAMLLLILFNGCYDREIIDQKDFNFSLPNVDNLTYTTADGQVTLTWAIPGTISDEGSFSVKKPALRLMLSREKTTGLL